MYYQIYRVFIFFAVGGLSLHGGYFVGFFQIENNN